MLEPDKNRIEDVKRRLYNPADSGTHQREGVLHQIPHKVAEGWEKPLQPQEDPNVMKKPPTSGLKKFFIVAVIFFMCALGFGFYMYSHTTVSVSNDNIAITVLGNAFAKGGEELPLQVEIKNNNNAGLELTNLLVQYPRGANDNTTDVVRLPRDSIGTIAPGQTVTRNIKATLFGDEKSVRNISVSLEYHPEGSNAIFSKDIQYPVTISSAPISLLIDAPTTATVDQDVSFKVTAMLNTALPADQTILQMSYPSGFIFESATPTPSVNSNVWDLSGLTQANPIVINVKGKFVGQDGDQQVFHAYAGTASPTDKSTVAVVYTSLLQTMTLTKPFLEAHVLVDGQDLPSYTATSDETVHAQVTWTNNLSSRIADAQIILNLSGSAFDKSTVDSLDGFYDSQNNRIIWDKNSLPDLASIEPGASGTAAFTFKPLSLIGTAGSTIKNPQINLDVNIKGSQPNLGSTFNDVNNVSQKIIKILSDFQIATAASYLAGSMPPKAETDTQYNITWTLSNSANSIVQAQAKAVLPIYVSWVGVANGSNEDLSFNQTTREVIWNIGSVPPNTGFTSNREVTFTVDLKPSLSQVGSVPQLIKEVDLVGQDVFAGATVKSSKGALTTLLSNDPGFTHGNERVIK